MFSFHHCVAEIDEKNANNSAKRKFIAALICPDPDATGESLANLNQANICGREIAVQSIPISNRDCD